MIAEKKLPIIQIVKEAVTLSRKNSLHLLRFALPLILTFNSSFLYEKFVGPTGGLLDLGLVIGVVFLYLITFVMMSIAYYRTFLLDQQEIKKTPILRWSHREMGWLWKKLLIGISFLSLGLIYICFLFLMLQLFSQAPTFGFAFLVFCQIMMIGLCSYITARWMLVFPAIAVDHEENSLSWAWAISAGNGWRLMLLLMGLPIITHLGLNFLLGFGLLSMLHPMLYSLLANAIWMVIVALEIAILSRCFAYLTKEEREQIKIAA